MDKTWLTERCAQDHQLASILFRAGPQEPIKEGQKLEIHPMLDLVDCVGHSGNPNKAMLPLKTKQKQKMKKKNRILNPLANMLKLNIQQQGPLQTAWVNAYDYAAVDDFATRPACTELHINMAEIDVGTLSCKTGITNRQILRKTIPFWQRHHASGKRLVWLTGWDLPFGLNDGSVFLHAYQIAP